MKKFLLVPGLALAVSLGAIAPAHAGTLNDLRIANPDPVAILIAMLLPAIQK